VSEDAGIEPRTVATTALAVRRSNHSARSHPRLGWMSSTSARSHPHSARSIHNISEGSVADPHRVDADPVPDHVDPDPDQDPACHGDADPDPDPSFQIKPQHLEKVLK
jgi:hypothetical protein